MSGHIPKKVAHLKTLKKSQGHIQLIPISDETKRRGGGGVRYAPRVERAVRGRHGACVASCAEELCGTGCVALSPTQSRPVPEMVHAQHACAREASTPEVQLIIVHPHAPQPVDGEDAGQTRNPLLVDG